MIVLLAPRHIKIHKTTKLIDKIPGVSNCYFLKFVYPNALKRICGHVQFKKFFFGGLYPGPPWREGATPPAPSPVRPEASHGGPPAPQSQMPMFPRTPQVL
jgi:hypothetical protein